MKDGQMIGRFPRMTMFAALLVMICGASSSRADEAANVKEAAMSFARALSEGNAEHARKFATTNDATTAFVDLIAPMSAAETKLHDAAIERFGQSEGSKMTNGATPAQVFNEYAKHPADMVVDINGDSAKIRVKPKQGQKEQGQPLSLKRVEGKWKVDLSDVLDVGTIKSRVPQFKAITRAMSDTADEIKAGRYANVHDAKVALSNKVMASRPKASEPQR